LSKAVVTARMRQSVGFYGKLPVVGDFVSRRLPVEFIEPWDQWLQNNLSYSRQLLQEKWLDYYLTCPVWRFVLGKGVLDESVWLGVLMSSMDKVGRYFPLTLALAVNDEQLIGKVLTAKVDFFKHLEDIAISGLAEDCELESFDQALCSVIVPEPEKNDGCLTSRLRFGVTLKRTQAATVERLAVQLDRDKLPSSSLWISQGSEHVDGFVRIFDGLPAEADFNAMLTC